MLKTSFRTLRGAVFGLAFLSGAWVSTADAVCNANDAKSCNPCNPSTAADYQKIVGGGSNLPVLYQTQGEVFVEGQEVGEGQTMKVGSTLRTGPYSQAAVIYPDGQRVTLKSDSAIKIKRYNYNPKKPKANVSETEVLSLDDNGGVSFTAGEIEDLNREELSVKSGETDIRMGGTCFLAVNSSESRGMFSKVQGGKISVNTPESSSSFSEDNPYVVTGTDGLSKEICSCDVPRDIMRAFKELECIPQPDGSSRCGRR